MRKSPFLALLAAALLQHAAVAAGLAEAVEFDIPAQSLDTALLKFSEQAGIQVFASTKSVSGKATVGIHGHHVAQEALTALLKDSGLTFRPINDRTVAVAPPETSALALPKSPLRLALMQEDARPADESAGEAPPTLAEIVVTGSRLPRMTREGIQDVKVYDRLQIERSGQTSVADFLNTLPEVSVALHDNNTGINILDSTVQLHGLPMGTTLVLLNGRRLQGSGSASVFGGDFFNLNNIPMAAIERIEVLAEGASAIYGSDAIAGVINIILKKDFDGLEASTKYGFASDTGESTSAFAWGKRWERGALSVIGSFQKNSELAGFDRSITATGDFTPFGGIDNRVNYCNPGNVFSAETDGSGNLVPLPGAPPGVDGTIAAVSPDASGNPGGTGFMGTYGELNMCSYGTSFASAIPARKQSGVLAQGDLAVASGIELFTELMASRGEVIVRNPPVLLFGQPGFQIYTVSASNPFNPFGVTVGVGYLLDDLGRQSQEQDTDFVRALTGAKGTLADRWHWELATWLAGDHTRGRQRNFEDSAAIQAALDSSDPATALNVFTAGPAGSDELLESLVGTVTSEYRGQAFAASGFLHGSAWRLPAGTIEVAAGMEYNRTKLDVRSIVFSGGALTSPTLAHRNSRSLFGEARIPLLGRGAGASGERLAATLAGRYDDYNDFGNKFTPQVGVEWRPLNTLLVRASYAESFKAPTLPELYTPGFSFQTFASDPLNGGVFLPATVSGGGNADLQPESGVSRTFGLVYSAASLPDLKVSLTYWGIDATDSIQAIDFQAIVDNEALFPGRVTRGPGQNGNPGPIIAVDNSYLNFGRIEVRGIDYRIGYGYRTSIGKFSPSVSATQTSRYLAALTPNVPPTDAASKAQDTRNWAPRWKGIVSLGWEYGPFNAGLNGRYVGSYQDYDSTTRRIGNFWLCDANFKYSWRESAYASVGAVNLFDKLPQYSNFVGGGFGYDPAQGDIRGRFVYGQVGFKW